MGAAASRLSCKKKKKSEKKKETRQRRKKCEPHFFSSLDGRHRQQQQLSRSPSFPLLFNLPFVLKAREGTRDDVPDIFGL